MVPELVALVGADLRRAVLRGTSESGVRYVIRVCGTAATTPRIAAVVQFRVAHAAHQLGIPLLPRLIQARIQRMSGADLHPSVIAGGGLVLVHSGGVVFGEGVRIGANLRCHQNVTLGNRSSRPQDHVDTPALGDDVTLSVGAVILGGIHIGDRAVVGANSLVLDDVNADDVVVGTPARSTSRQHAG